MSIVQSVIFDTTHWSVLESVRWLLDHNYKVKKIDIPDKFIRYRQVSPTTLKKKGYTEYHNKKIGRGIELVIAYKPNIEYNYDYRN